MESRRENVLRLLLDGEWHSTSEIESARVGGSQGTRRLRELRKIGVAIEKKRKPDSTQFLYRLVPNNE